MTRAIKQLVPVPLVYIGTMKNVVRLTKPAK
jgi:hypothetical protein